MRYARGDVAGLEDLSARSCPCTPPPVPGPQGTQALLAATASTTSPTALYRRGAWRVIGMTTACAALGTVVGIKVGGDLRLDLAAVGAALGKVGAVSGVALLFCWCSFF